LCASCSRPSRRSDELIGSAARGYERCSQARFYRAAQTRDIEIYSSLQPPRAQQFIETAKLKITSRATLPRKHLRSKVNEMPSSFMSLEKPRSLAAHTGTQDVEHTTHCPKALHPGPAVCGFSAGAPRGDLFLPALSDPDPCIAPRARKRRDASWIHDQKETNW
jgi:hypothetical protein